MPFIIHRKPPYRIYIEEGQGSAMAHVAELPGCFTVSPDAATAVRAMPGAIVRYLAWLRSHREPLVPEAYVSRPSVADLFVAEVRQEGAPTMAGSKAALFESDSARWDDEKLERTLRWLDYSRADLLAKIDGMDEAEMKARMVAPNRSLWRTLWHVANAEYGYINAVDGPLKGEEPITDEYPADIRGRLAAIRDMLHRRARAIPAEKRADVVYPAWTDRPGEPWTLPKTLRRALEHELEHLAEF